MQKELGFVPEEIHSQQFLCEIVDGISVLELSAWPGAGTSLTDLVTQLSKAGCVALAIAPERYWIISTASREMPVAHDRVAVVNLSDALSVMRLSGERVKQVLQKGLPVDLHESVFKDGGHATSMIDGIAVTVVRQGDAFDLYCRRSYRESMLHWLNDASLEFR